MKIIKIIKIHIKKPFISEKLAEFVGIVLGDGSISKTGYCLQITLNKTYEKQFLSYVSGMIVELFSIEPKFIEFKDRNTMALRVNSLELFQYLKELDVSIGDSEKSIPRWVTDDENLTKSCIRGLFDSDGSVFLSSRWCVLNFKSSSRYIFGFFKDELSEMGIPTFKSGISVNATSLWKIEKFFNVVGSSNLKHVIKFIEYMDNRKTVRSDYSLSSLFSKYKNIELPFFYRGP